MFKRTKSVYTSPGFETAFKNTVGEQIYLWESPDNNHPNLYEGQQSILSGELKKLDRLQPIPGGWEEPVREMARAVISAAENPNQITLIRA